MFDFDVGKLLLIGVVALIFIPPKDLPGALRQLGRLMGQARRMATDFRAQFDEALRESDLHELKDEFSQIRNKASIEGTMNRIADMMEIEKPAATQPPQLAKIEPAGAESQMIERADLPPPAAPNEQPAALNERPAALGDQPAALGDQPEALKEQPAALGEQKS